MENDVLMRRIQYKSTKETIKLHEKPSGFSSIWNSNNDEDETTCWTGMKNWFKKTFLKEEETEIAVDFNRLKLTEQN